MPERIEAREAVLAWRPDIGGAVISVVVDGISADGAPLAFARVGVEDDGPYLERNDGSRVVLVDIDVDDVREALELDVVVVREFADEGAGASREYPIEGLAPAMAPGM